MTRAVAVMAKAVPSRAGWRLQCSFWPASDGAGTPVSTGGDRVCFGDAPRGVLALFTADRRNGRLAATADRAGIQAIHYARNAEGHWLLSTHLHWLLRELGHAGDVDDEGFFEHFAFGYTVHPDLHVFRGIRRIPPGSALVFDSETPRLETYWTPPLPSEPLTADIADALAVALRAATATPDPAFLALTAGKDSLCLAGVVDEYVPVMTGTFGPEGCADRLQGPRIADCRHWPHFGAELCPASELPLWVRHVALHSGGLATASYVDMARFAATTIPPGHTFVMGEGGECVRDFFGRNGTDPVQKIAADYTTPSEFLRRTLAPRFHALLDDYPAPQVDRLRRGLDGPAELFPVQFYRLRRLPGNFSLRHSLLSPLRAKSSPFLAPDFADAAYRVAAPHYANALLHRAVLERAAPGLLPFFDRPVKSPVSTQEWPARLNGPAGEAMHALLAETLPFCEDLFDRAEVLNLFRESARAGSRGIWHVFRVLSFAAHRKLLAGANPVTALPLVDLWPRSQSE